MKQLENKIAIVTGGASGIGKAIVELFVKEGLRVGTKTSKGIG
jgi:NAD(P)-dependent dehydrogenase (short-subunit alcohol dehydrogenase family)